jgi:integrase
MARTTKPLSHTEIKQAKVKDKEYSLADGKNLYLRIKPSGGKQWIFNYYRPGTNKRANLGLGVFPEVSLLAARKKAEEARSVLANGIDPKDHKEETKRSGLEKNANTFEHIAQKWLELKKGSVSDGYHAKIIDRLDKYIFPKMGSTPIHKVSAARTIEIISPLAKADKLETVKKVCRWVNEVMVYAVNTGITHANPLAGIGKAFNAPKVQNMLTLKPEELPELMYKIQHSNTKLVTRCLIEWQLHTMVRPGEAASARWDEIDENKHEWTIPAERMKKNKPHIIPLTKESLKLLDVLKPISRHREYIFPSDHNPRKPANSQSANRALARMGFRGRLVSHGMRALASTTLNEQGFDADVIEAALAHVDKDAIRGAYNRAQYINRRRPMMQWWSEQIARSAADAPLKGAATKTLRSEEPFNSPS